MDQISSTQVLPFYGIERTAPSDIIFTNCSTNVHECFDNYRIREDGNWLLNFVDRFYQALLWICPTFFIKYLKYVNSFCALRSIILKNLFWDKASLFLYHIPGTCICSCTAQDKDYKCGYFYHVYKFSVIGLYTEGGPKPQGPSPF